MFVLPRIHRYFFLCKQSKQLRCFCSAETLFSSLGGFVHSGAEPFIIAVYQFLLCSYIILSLLLLNLSLTALVVSSPRDVTVANGTWASFECRISCTHVFYWFVGSGRYRRLTNVDVNRFVQRNGIQVEVSRSSGCTNDGDYTQQLTVLATPEVNGIAVQCAAVSRPPTADGVFFSSYAVLMVNPIGQSQHCY